MVLLAVGVVILAAFILRMIVFHQEAAYVEVMMDGSMLGRYPLSEDRELLLQAADGGYNLLQIEDRSVRVLQADCPGLDCVHQGRISHTGETLICLPHRLEIRIKGKQEADYDAVAE